MCAVALALLAPGCSGEHKPSGTPTPSKGPLVTTVPLRPPASLTAEPVPPTSSRAQVGPDLAWGTTVPSADVPTRSRLVGNVMYGLTGGERSQGLASLAYPTLSRDAGRTWVIDGPVFWIAAADGAEATSVIQAASPEISYAWGDGSYLRSTTDGGRHWWQTIFPTGSIFTVRYGTETLTVVTYGTNGKNGVTYTSTDSGQTWKLQPPTPNV